MTTEADTLVVQFPDRIGQLKGPVYDYLKRGMPYTQDPQDLYMQVFYPKARKWSPETEFSAKVQKVNPGIKTVGDYVRKVEAPRSRPALAIFEEDALRTVADKLGVSRDSLYNLINFESGWDPEARNPYSGARGLIQFMPSTARWMGFGRPVSFLTVLFVLGTLYFIIRKAKLF